MRRRTESTPRFSDAEILQLRAVFSQQVYTVAAILMSGLDIGSEQEAAESALALLDEVLVQIEEESE